MNSQEIMVFTDVSMSLPLLFQGHMYYYAAASFDNLQLAFSYGESLALQPFFAAALSVDSFYTISGFLLAYAFYEKQKKRPSRSLAMDVVKGTINRYIRIAPCFMIVRILFYIVALIEPLFPSLYSLCCLQSHFRLY